MSELPSEASSAQPPQQPSRSAPVTDTEQHIDSLPAPADAKAPGFLSMLQSVAAAAFGVQSEKKRQQDFQHGKPGDYIALGVIFVVVFIISLVVIVNMVLDSAAK